MVLFSPLTTYLLRHLKIKSDQAKQKHRPFSLCINIHRMEYSFQKYQDLQSTVMWSFELVLFFFHTEYVHFGTLWFKLVLQNNKIYKYVKSPRYTTKALEYGSPGETFFVICY